MCLCVVECLPIYNNDYTVGIIDSDIVNNWSPIDHSNEGFTIKGWVFIHCVGFRILKCMDGRAARSRIAIDNLHILL